MINTQQYSQSMVSNRPTNTPTARWSSGCWEGGQWWRHHLWYVMICLDSSRCIYEPTGIQRYLRVLGSSSLIIKQHEPCANYQSGHKHHHSWFLMSWSTSLASNHSLGDPELDSTVAGGFSRCWSLGGVSLWRSLGWRDTSFGDFFTLREGWLTQSVSRYG